MAKYLVICGHGLGVNGYDPGCTHGSQTEADYVRRFAKAMQAYDEGLIDYITDKDVFSYDSNGYGLFADFAQQGYEAIIELHVDAAASHSAEDGHVIILNGYEPDELDYRIRDVISAHVGSQRGDWNYDGVLDGIAGRDNLWNVNQAANYGLNYRLVELGFMTNDQEREYLYNHINDYAAAMAAAIIGKEDEEMRPEVKAWLEALYDRCHEEEAPEWAKKELEEAKEKGITDGTRPNDFATRAEVAAMIVRAKEDK